MVLQFDHTNRKQIMKRFATTYTNGHTVETSSPHEAQNIQNFDDAQTFFLAGKPVAAAKFFAEVQSAVQAAWDKKNETHKRMRVLHGSSVGCYVDKWVRR